MHRKLFQYLLGLLLLAPLSLAAQGTEEAQDHDILILSSHTISSEWEQNMLRPIQELRKERPDIQLEIHRFQILAYQTADSLIMRRDQVLKAREKQPALVILLGGSCFNFALAVNDCWPDVPMILIGEQDYYCDLEYTLFGPGDPDAQRYPLSTLKTLGFNLTLIHTPVMVRRTVDLMFQLQPDMKKFIFIAGENYMCKERQWRLEQYMEQQHPDIPFQVISATNTSTDRLLTILQQESSPETGVYYGSWLTRDGYLENISTRHKTVSLIESIAPVYTMFGVDMEKHPNVVGYYSYPVSQYEHAVRDRILDVLDRGIQPAKMSFLHLDVGVPTISAKAMEHFGLDTGLIPADALVQNYTNSFWQANKSTIMWMAFFLMVGLGIFLTFTMGRSLVAMKKAREIAEKGNQIKTSFIQNLSHEIRTPLNSIVGFSQLLSMPGDMLSDEEKEEYLGYITNNSHLLTVMINDMLDLSALEKGQYSVNKAPCNLNEMVRQAIKSVEQRLPPGVEIIRQPGIKEEDRYITDGMRVQQILINFLTNACKNTTSGSIVIASSLMENPGYITFSVADTGIGVPPDQAESIFDRFVKLDISKQGAGLGLNISRLMATALGGNIWLDTSYTDGARFVLAIPMVKESAPKKRPAKK